MAERRSLEEMERKIEGLSQKLAAARQKNKALKAAESYYRAFFEHGSDGIVILNPVTFEFIDFNNQACRQLGYSRKEFACLRVPDIEAQEGVEETRRHVDTIMKEGFGSFETLHRTKDGVIRNIFVLAKVIEVDNRKIYHCIWRDITRQKRAETSLRDSEQKYRELVENIGEAIYATDPSGILTYISPVCEKILGYRPQEMIGRVVWDFIFREDHDYVQNGYKEVFGDKNEPSEYRLVKKNGETVWVRSFSRPNLKNGKLTGIQGVITDVSDLKKSQDINSALEKQLYQSHKMEAIGTLAGGIAHDFNNILSPITGFAELMLMELPGDSPFRDHLLQIMASAKRGSRLTRQILSFSRMEEAEKKPLDTRKLVQEVINFLRPTIPATVEIRQALEPGVGYVMADSNQIHQVLMNLITNACHAIQDDDGLIVIDLCSATLDRSSGLHKNLVPGAYVCLKVSDSGSGIEKEHMDRIFDPYFTTKDKDSGTGLGLANVQSIVKNHKGHIEVESELGRGTVFSIYLPKIAQVASRPKLTKLDELKKGDESVLVVDDEVYITKMTKEILEKLGYTVTATTRCDEALAAFLKDPCGFDLVITDMAMPKMTGARLSEKILAIRNDIPIILCTGFSDKINEEAARDIGIKGFLFKPVELTVLAETVRSVLDEQS